MVSMKEYLKIPQLNIIFSKKICEEFWINILKKHCVDIQKEK